MEPDRAIRATFNRLAQLADRVTASKPVYGETGEQVGTEPAVDPEQFEEWVTSALHLLETVFAGTVHYQRFQQAYGHYWGNHDEFLCMKAIMEAARNDYDAGMLQKITSMATAEVFADFLTMAEYLLDDGYKDAAAVLVGGVLEEHLRKLSVKNGMPLEDRDAKGVAHPRKADRMNAELGSAGAYSKGDQKMVTGWLDLRNNAAHGKYDAYVDTQVRIILEGVRDFIRRNRA